MLESTEYINFKYAGDKITVYKYHKQTTMNKSSKILLFLALLVVFTSAKAPDLQRTSLQSRLTTLRLNLS